MATFAAAVDDLPDLVDPVDSFVWRETFMKHARHADTALAEFNRELRLDHYGVSCRILSVNGLLIHRGYKYGTEWLVKIVPEDVIDELKLLFSSND